jgi:hypothetical protein
MKTIVALLLLVGASPFAFAKSLVADLLPRDIDLDVLGPFFGSLHGSCGLAGAAFFAFVVLLRLKRSGR